MRRHFLVFYGPRACGISHVFTTKGCSNQRDTLHAAAKSSSALDQHGKAAAAELLKAGLAELEWLREEAQDMAALGRERLAPDPPGRRS